MNPETKLRRDGRLLGELAHAALAAISTNQELLNALNVFPVPDGDTGTNMTLTMRSIADEMERWAVADVPESAERMARAALLGARGNSGLIMAQLFRGLREALKDANEINGSQIASGLAHAVELAYGAVPQPKEGTMLTVLREASESAKDAVAASDATLISVVSAVSERAMDAVERTPEMLEVLKEAGVVDSGGLGLAIMFIGMEQRLKGEGDGAVEVEAPGIDADLAVRGGAVVDTDFIDSAEEEIWGYCTVFAIEGEGLDVDGLRVLMDEIGRSPVVAGDDTLIKVHVHMEDPGQALSAGIALGTVSNIDIKNMDEQTADWAMDRRSDADGDGAPAIEDIDVAVVAVGAGDGIVAFLKEAGMGACSIVDGGDSMNPSVADVLRAIDNAPSANVIVLPNNKNIIGAAEQASEIAEKDVSVVPTRSIQAGITAMSVFDPDGSLDENVEEMSEALEGLSVGAVFRASRDVTIDGIEAKRGEFMVTVDDEAADAGGPAAEMLIAGIRSVIHDGALVSIYVGADADEEDIEKIESIARDAVSEHRNVEVATLNGGQPHYAYLFSIE